MADLSNLLQLSQQMQGRLSEIQTQLAQQTVTVSAGGGIVQATADGRGQIRAIKIDPQAVRRTLRCRSSAIPVRLSARPPVRPRRVP